LEGCPTLDARLNSGLRESLRGGPFVCSQLALAADGLAQRDCDAEPRDNHARRETLTPLVVVTVQEAHDLPPATGGRHWTAEHYRERDAVLGALGLPTFGRRRVSDAQGYLE
jgi:hypothetical protein